MDNSTFNKNLRLVDTLLPEILSISLLNFYSGKGRKINEVSELLSSSFLSLSHEEFTFKVKFSSKTNVIVSNCEKSLRRRRRRLSVVAVLVLNVLMSVEMDDNDLLFSSSFITPSLRCKSGLRFAAIIICGTRSIKSARNFFLISFHLTTLCLLL